MSAETKALKSGVLLNIWSQWVDNSPISTRCAVQLVRCHIILHADCKIYEDGPYYSPFVSTGAESDSNKRY